MVKYNYMLCVDVVCGNVVWCAVMLCGVLCY